ncbi:hypothetical protein LN565_11510 [Xanthomonas euvesicatoria pv. euvesicatoria]|uniref:Uncharacterized protein n=3 Tax=Xanthomonas euvesicatoria TaxID=456327 RepID=Q3BWK8_XANE5|nr:hypothetical protein [Xanthomonas euvesicatoria]AOY68705.1 hypothetical protein BHE83_20615 [Xanthomonas euvesicatoria pv. vesicatoria str. 85-10]APO91502.1 hypothetical protein BJD11_17040 [Xanthomonas euvesicatoria]KHL60750.1 hypothetical protein XEU66b_14590 [Xanthomonas euvesicatoria]KHL65583.1 hypothetical protein XEU83M_11270 [Xanthomonas euvesicatoria]KLA49310.1 hypothetical protein XEUV683_22730 [Xanthomonas euvesicatoria]
MKTHPQQLEIAGHLLAGLMSQTLSDEPLVRQRNVCNAWASAGELIVYSQKKPPGGGNAAQSLEHAPPRPSPAVRTREAVIVRKLPSVEEWRAGREKKDAQLDPVRSKKRPTLH